jgi:curli biogenesis system outer membrane secretion channel CsgG
LLPALVLGAGAFLAPLACVAADPQPGGGHATQAQGAAAGGTSSEANSQLEACSETLGTIMIDEQTNAGWYAAYQSQYKMGSTVPALRLIIQQSNCFVIVDRGRGLAARTREADLIRGEEGRAGSNYGKGQIAAADYTMIPEVILSDRGGTRGGAGLGGLLGRSGFGAAIAGIAGSMSTNEAGAILTLVDNRSTVQLAASEGYSKNIDFAGMGALFGGSGGGAAGAYTSTPQGKVIFAAFTDSYNKMVRALRNYKAQTVRGGLGTGGRLGVQGGGTDASREVDAKPQR